MDYRYNGERDSKKKQNIAEAVEFILDIKYGQTVSNEKLAKILGYNIETEEEFRKYRATMGRVRKFLLQYGYVLKSIAGIGYYILKPSEISRHCYKTYIKSAARMYDKSDFVLEHTDQTELTEERLEEYKSMRELTKQLIENAELTLTESVYYNRKAYYDSLKD